MRKFLFNIILVFAFVNATATNYTWSSSSTNILISDAGVFGNLTAGDTVFIPVRSGGYRSYSIQNVNSGTAGQYIVVYWRPGAYRTPSGSNNFADLLDNAIGVKTVGMEAEDHVDLWRHGTTGYSSYLWWDSCNFANSSGIGPIYTGALTSYNGNIANSMHHWKFTYCNFDSLYNNGSGGIAIRIGALNRYGYWFDTEVSNCTFDNYSSAGVGGTSNYIQAFNCYNTLITNNRFSRLGNDGVANPVGHASVINAYSFHGTISNNIFGPNIFGNDVRGKFADNPTAGADYTGLSRIFNNLSFSKRKYPVIEVQQTDTAGFGGGYARRRSSPQVWNITAYNVAVGVGNDPYQTAIVDCYLTDSVHVKNSVLTVIRDTTWGTGLGPFMFTQSSGAITFKDTASNRLVQLWVNSGLADSVYYYPSPTGTLFSTGVAVPSYITTDIYGNPRTQGAAVDIGAAEYPEGINYDRITVPRPGRRLIFED